MKRLKAYIFISLILLSVIITTNSSAQPSQKAFQLKGKDMVANFDFFQGKYLRLRSLLPESYNGAINLPVMSAEGDNEVALHCTGEDRDAHHGAKLTGGNPGMRLEFVAKHETKTDRGTLVVIIQQDPIKKLKVESFYEFADVCPAVRRYTRVTNEGSEDVGIEYLSSAMLNNFGYLTKGHLEDNLLIHFAYNTWMAEAQWKSRKPSELGWVENGYFSLNGIFMNSLGSWSTIKYLPMGMIENKQAGLTWFWQIEHNGSWHSEISDIQASPFNSTYLYLGGPDEEHSHAWKNLKPGESYQTVPVALGCVKGGFEQAIEALTAYRRTFCLKPNVANKTCPVIFNDYMNCLNADPTTEKEIPLVDAAAAAGCEYYVIDAGWYAEQNENWWVSVGMWQPSKTRFTGGLQKLLDYIKSKGLKPGLWLELEVAGIHSPLISKPDSWFFMRHGKRVIDHGRYILDFRNPEVIAHANEVIDRLAKTYGINYIKMDYNINALEGTETNVSSIGQGLLENNRAFLKWADDVNKRYPDLVIENCGSGGCRMDYAMLSHFQLQSSSDQMNYKKYPGILVGAMAAVLPEQLAVWSYPLEKGTPQEASFNMVNAMLCIIHQSGNLSKLSTESLEQVKSGIAIYKKQIRPYIPGAVSFFPLGMPSISDEISPISVGIRNGGRSFISVWRLKGDKTVILPNIVAKQVKLIYPENLGIKVLQKNNNVTVSFPDEFMGAILEVMN